MATSACRPAHERAVLARALKFLEAFSAPLHVRHRNDWSIFG